MPSLEAETAPFELAGSKTLPGASTPPPPLLSPVRLPELPVEPDLHLSSLEVAGAALAAKSDVLCEIDRVDVDITELEGRLRKLGEADFEEDEEVAEDAAARLPPPRPRPRRPLPPRVVAVAQHSAAADAFSATSAATVLAALGPIIAAPGIELLSTGNAERAARAADLLGLPSFVGSAWQPFDSTTLLARNAATHARLCTRVAPGLARRAAAQHAQASSLALEYSQRQARWVTALAEQTDLAVRLPYPACFAAPVDTHGGATELAVERAAERERTHARLPAQLSASEARVRVFPGRNALVHAPVAAAADEARARPWSAAERRTFLDKFSLYGKDFARIATHLAARSTADCVVYYYRTQKVDDGFGGKRKAALKKRRQYAAVAAMGFGTVAAFRDVDAGRQRERAAPTAEARQEKAALAAAARAAAVSKEKAARAGRGAKRRERDPEDAAQLTAAEVARVLDALPRVGKSFRALAAATGVAVSSLKAFWTSHRATYGLEALAAQASGGITADACGLTAQQGPANVFAVSSAPGLQPAAMDSALRVSADALRSSVSAFADAPSPGAEAAGAVADERGRHPLLTAVQFIRTHANAQLRGEQHTSVAVPGGEAGSPPEPDDLVADDRVEDAVLAPVLDECETGVDAADTMVASQPCSEHAEPDLSSGRANDSESFPAPQSSQSIEAGGTAAD